VQDFVTGQMTILSSDPPPALHSVMLNLANKFSQCTFSAAELFGGLIILRQAWWHWSYDDISHRTDT